jgi:hypothetical protein
MFLGSARRGQSWWVCASCAAMFEGLARLLGGSPRRNPKFEVVK